MEAAAGTPLSPAPMANPVASFQDQVEWEMRRLQLIGPAIGLIVVGILGIVHWAIVLAVAIVEDWYRWKDFWKDFGPGVVILGPIVLVSSPLIIAGGRKMLRLE